MTTLVTAGSVTYSTLTSQAWNNVYSLLAANLTDPVSSSVQGRKWIYSRTPDTKSVNFGGYPFIVIRPATISYPASPRQSLDTKHRVVSWSFQVDIVTSDRAYGERDGQGSTDLDSISDQVLSILNNASNRNTLRGYGMAFSNPVPTSVVTEPLEETMSFRRSFDLSFTSRFTVSA